MSDTGRHRPRLAKFRWQNAVSSPSGPPSPTTRHVLLTLSLDANKDGRSCYPSVERLARRTGLHPRTVVTHLELAEDGGWIERRRRGRSAAGQGWRRTSYTLRLPADVMAEGHHVEEREEEHVTPELGAYMERGGPGSRRTGPPSRGAGRGSRRGGPEPHEHGVDHGGNHGIDEGETVGSGDPTFMSLSLDAWRTAVRDRDRRALASSGLAGLTHAEAHWLLTGLEPAELLLEDPPETVATVLHDLARKPPHKFTRRRFAAYVSQAARIRDPLGLGLEDDELESCWPTTAGDTR